MLYILLAFVVAWCIACFFLTMFLLAIKSVWLIAILLVIVAPFSIAWFLVKWVDSL